MQTSPGCGDPERVVARFLLAVSLIIEQQQPRGEKHFLRLTRGDSMALVLESVACIPLELGNFR